MNQANGAIPQGGQLTRNMPPGDRPSTRPEEQGPLGSAPSYDDVLDTAVDYSFPCSDPIAVQQCCKDSAKRT